MKTSHKFIRFTVLFSLSFWIIGFSPSSLETSLEKIMADGFVQETVQQKLSPRDFVLTNSRNGQPLENYLVYFIDTETSTLVDVQKSDETGKLTAMALADSKEYKLRVVRTVEETGAVELIEEASYIHQPDTSLVAIETYMEREKVHIGVPVLMQEPELPNGCEITTLTAVLNHYRLKISKTAMAEDYLPKSDFFNQDGKRFGPDPHQAYAGDPQLADGGWYVFSEPIVEASKKLITDKYSRLITENVSGSTPEEILSYTDRKIPVIVWVTLDLSPPVISGGWYIEETGEFHQSFTNLHSVVLEGWEDGKVYVMDPLKGKVSYPEKLFFDSYQALGSQAVAIRR